MEDDTSLTPQEVADLLKIAKNTVYELIKRGELNGYRVGKKVRVDFGDVVAYKNKSRNFEPVKAQTQETAPAGTETKADLPSAFVICGQDIILDILARHLEERFRGLHTLRSYLGSYNGLFELYTGNVHIATAHMWDSRTNSYNIPYICNMLPGTPAVVYRLVRRMEGFYVAKGNPKNISGWEDLKRKDITFVNRELGSGARILIDEHLRQLGLTGNDLPGYGHNCTSHLTVASTVARGEADFGLGIEKVGLQVSNIDFIPLQMECYDMVFKKEDADKPVFKAAVDILRSNKFTTELAGIGGYDLSELGKLVGET